MINITNWILTRKCNLKCSYCSLIKNYNNKPIEYPDMDYYYKNEMQIDDIIKTIEKIQINNPNCFHIFFGGEPLLRTDIFELIKYCNDNDVQYTIISNSSDDSKYHLEYILSKTYIKSFTSSVDPIILNSYNSLYDNLKNDEFQKSKNGFMTLLNLKNYIKDLVAEITVTNQNIPYLYNTVKLLSNNNITSNINFIDIKKNDYYDFSNITLRDNNIFVYDIPLLRREIDKIFKDKLKVHFGKDYIENTLIKLPSNFDCEIEKEFYDLTIDSDGSIRLCLRIRGVETPKNINIKNFINKKGELNSNLIKYIKKDKKSYCQKCIWSGIIMSTYMYHDKTLSLVH
jgi:MoaA/NifB/PqqE/SkfB family radical SAM enzyme